jgi:hypothetical protein
MSESIFQEDFEGVNYEGALGEWVIGKCQEWRDHYESNYSEKHEEYYRLFRNQWSSEDKTRDSERSKLIAPALAQAVESNVAEIEEATFGRGKIFDVRDNVGDQETGDMIFLRKKLHEMFERARIRTAVSEVLVNAAVFGTGVGELVLDEVKTLKPATRPLMDGTMQQVGVEEGYEVMVRLNPIQPKNFLIDPSATSIDEAMGCAVDEYVSRHVVEQLQEQQIYKDVFVGEASSDSDIEADRKLASTPSGRVRLTKYYGLVPRDLLIAEGLEDEDITEKGHYVEAVVVIANESVVLKAIPSPYMCQDRPIVAFQWDVVPSLFWGRGVCEKGYMSQKALDAELRARIDALALTTHPMMAMDATRIPRGHKMEIRPGRVLLTNGSPGESIMPFNFGQLSNVTFQQGATLQQMVSQATGAADGSMPQVQNDVTAAGMSMSQGAIVKRQKRTLVNFQENFLIPLVTKSAHRYMQFDPDNFPVKDYSFIPFSSLGAMAREYEVGQLSQILQVTPPNSPAHAALVTAIIDHLNVSNREQLIAAIEQGNQPNPQQQQLEQQKLQVEMAIAQGQVALLQSQASESRARAEKYNVESRLAPVETSLKYSDQNNDGKVDEDFEKRVRMADLLLREQEIQIKRTASERAGTSQKEQAEAELIRQLSGMGQPPQPPQGPQGGL